MAIIISKWRELDRWFFIGALISVLLALPVLAILLSYSSLSVDLWAHLVDTTLAEYLTNSVLLTLGVGFGSMLLGVTLAWCVTQYSFWGRGVFEWALLLPLAMPAYIMAYTYTGMFDQFGWFDSRTLMGAIVFMSLVLYPYVYILAKTAFSLQQRTYQDAAASLGVTHVQYFFKIALPIARPAVFTGMALAMMEALADYGTVAYFGISTFTTGIFRTWFGMGEMQLASQLAGALALFVLLVLSLEKYSRKNMRFYQTQTPAKENTINTYTNTESTPFISPLLMSIGCFSVLVIAFIIPVLQLCIWAWDYIDISIMDEYLALVSNSFLLAFSTSLFIIVLALLLSYAQRFSSHPHVSGLIQFAALGYAIPGTVLAIGVLQPLGWLDEQINVVWLFLFDEYIGLVFSGTFLALIFAYCVRFLSVALHNTQNGLERIKPNVDDAVLTLGLGRYRIFSRVHLPLLKKSILAAGILVFVDVLKELPATLILRPFNFNTLAVKAFEYATDERLLAAALPSVTIVLVGIIPVILLTRAMK